jgi:hypothetical protein
LKIKAVAAWLMANTTRHGHAVRAKRRFAQRCELVDDGIRGQTIRSAEQVITIERVGDQWFRTERSHAISTGDEDSHDALRPASRTIA